MSLRLAGKVAVITGAASGVGLKATKLFYQHGCRVVAADISPGIRPVIEEIVDRSPPRGGGSIVAQQIDISKPQQCQRMIFTATQRFGKLDILFNNAGIMHPEDDDAIQTEADIWDLTHDINVKGVFYGCKYGIPAMLESGGGSIINTASMVAFVGSATPQLAYTASKGAVVAMTQELAVLHAKDQIRVNALCPGPIETELLMKFLDTPEKLQRRLVHLPYGRFAQAQEIAEAALFLASDESKYVSGHKMMVDGALTCAYVTADQE